jgi:hypothetical protein
MNESAASIEITDEVLSQYHRWFENYANGIHSNDKMAAKFIALKKTHTEKVVEITGILAAELQLSPIQQIIANIIALFHDIGRFYQMQMYRTFNDKKSENHATIGVRVLLKHKLFDNIALKTRTAIYTAIMHHNMRHLPKFKDPETYLLSQLIRDADKLDIYRIVCQEYKEIQAEGTEVAKKSSGFAQLGFKIDDTITESILHGFLRHEQIPTGIAQTIADVKIMQLAWVYDFNFPESIRLVKKAGYLKQILDSMPDNDQKKLIKGADEF